MMGPTETTQNEYLAWDYPFAPTTVVVIVVGCALVMLWSLYRERQVLGTGTTSLFAALRSIAIITAIWMFVGTNQRVGGIHNHETRRCDCRRCQRQHGDGRSTRFSRRSPLAIGAIGFRSFAWQHGFDERSSGSGARNRASRTHRSDGGLAATWVAGSCDAAYWAGEHGDCADA